MNRIEYLKSRIKEIQEELHNQELTSTEVYELEDDLNELRIELEEKEHYAELTRQGVEW